MGVEKAMDHYCEVLDRIESDTKVAAGRPVSWSLLRSMLVGSTQWLLMGYVDSLARIKKLEARLGEIEQRGLEYRGTFNRSQSYKRGDLVTCAGGMWLCAVDQTSATPGKSSDWVLTAKGGDSK